MLILPVSPPKHPAPVMVGVIIIGGTFAMS